MRADFSELFHRYGPMVHRRAMHILGNRADAEEATQEAPPPPETVTVKGALGVNVFRARAGRVEPIISGARVRAGDRLRFEPTAMPAEGHHAIGADTAGPLYGFAPAGATASLPVSVLDAEGALPGASVLDDTPGETWAHLVWCPGPFGVADVARHDARDRLTVPRECRQSAVRLDHH